MSYVNPDGKASDFQPGDPVAYKVTWDGAPPPEPGVVSSVTETVVFVRYRTSVQGTDPRDLVRA